MYPWGNEWDATKCNTFESGLGGTTPVGMYPEGASPYGVLDLAGNVWEWTRSEFKGCPYRPDDGRENLDAGDAVLRVLRGGAFDFNRGFARCAYRYRNDPNYNWHYYGFRVVVSRAEPPGVT